MTLENDFNVLIGELEDNLQTMGVSDAEFDPVTGLRGLVARILDISGGGLDLDISATLTSDESSIPVGDSVTLTSVLTASYDDTSQENVDMRNGLLTGATVLFKEGSTTLGTGTTDNNGTATATISNLALGTHTIKAVFAGTSIWDNCESSSITVTVTQPFDGITLTSDKSILSYADHESATLTAQLTDGGSPASVSGETVTFEVRKQSDDSLVETLTGTTNSSGIATVSYLGKGVGDLYIKAECRLLIQSFAIEDCTYYNDTVYQNTTTPVQLDKTLPNGAFTVEYDGLQTTRDNSASYLLIGRGTNDRILIGQYARAGTNGLILYTGSQANHPLPNNTTLNAWNHFTFTYDGTDYKIDRDGESLTVTGVGIHLDKVLSVENGYAGKLKNIKVKPL